MRQRGLDVLTPILKDAPDSKEPFWKQHAASVSAALTQIPKTSFVTLVAHSGAGPLLPAIRQSIPGGVYRFRDAQPERGRPSNFGATGRSLGESARCW
jgi:hypothetical protein